MNSFSTAMVLFRTSTRLSVKGRSATLHIDKWLRLAILTISLLAIFLLNAIQLSAQSIAKVRHFDTWNGGTIRSTDPAGIGYHPASGHLYIADSEINELPVFIGDNIFEVSLLGDQVFRNIQSNNTEPTGITFNEFDGFFYLTNDDTQLITRYDSNLNNPLATVNTSDALPNATDPEGITSDPVTGLLYVADGTNGGCQVLIYDSNLVFQGNWTVNQFNDPEGIAFSPDNGNLFLVSAVALKIFEFTVDGTFIANYDISGFSPTPISPQGLTFAPTSDPNDPSGDLALYIADGMVDNFADGRVYETILLTTPPPVNITVVPAPGNPVIIPASGLIFSFDVTIDNNGASTLNAQTWNKVTLVNAGGEEVGPVAGIPVMNVTVGAGSSYTTTITLEVPAGVPASTYPFNQIVGTFPNVELARDTFTFIKSVGPTFIKAGDDDWGLSPAREVIVPEDFTLEQNYPNPFNPSTTIRYELSRAVNVRIIVFDLTGREVRELVNEYQIPGPHLVRWDGKDGKGRHVSSGMYIYQTQIGDFIQSRPMILTK